MAVRLLSARERVVWAALFVVVSGVIVVTGYSSRDADSTLYAGIADRLSQEPWTRWIAPEWWGFWPESKMTGLFRDHPAGLFVMTAALTLAGIPAAQGAYVIGLASGLVALLLMGAILARFGSREEARASLVVLQLMPVAFIFRVRANHEYPMLVCLLAAVLGLIWIAERRPFAAGTLLVAGGLTAGVLIKDVLALKIVLGLITWAVVNPTGSQKSLLKFALAIAIGLTVMTTGILVYDAAYLAVTAERFWGPYWERNLAPLTITSPVAGALMLAGHFLFYASRLIWHPAPWSLALLAGLWRWRGRVIESWRRAPLLERRGLAFTLLFAGVAILILSPSSRYAERYAFSATHAVACAGALASLRLWPRLATRLSRLDAAIPALPALVWLALALLRLGVGQVLPRV